MAPKKEAAKAAPAKAAPAKAAPKAEASKAVAAAKPKAKAAKSAPKPRLLAGGISKDSRSASYHRRGLWAIKKKHGGKFPTHEKTVKKAEAAKKEPRFYPAEDVKKPLASRIIKKQTKLRASITPGTVLILLAGRFKGKRVVFLKQLTSGLLLVTGPFKVNGVPLRRVNQAYVIATSTKVDVSKADVGKIADDFFKKAKKAAKKGESEFFTEDKEEKEEVSQEKIDAQKKVDEALLPAIEKVADLKSYLSARFSLTSGVKPHELVF
ncbi:60S ribosomal protein L6 [Klebsormidium nitens]|uniref:60S ribosomal protein L6 n=1 Tax=Klebsormidium nitens TaxID=105231 RepID=A0A1Y1IHX8_KLENI|nr:60S ribosomal protein L6 [Klebsormidium nitens]|eukprot:GAQ89109.1 60S ribosomal protein L6 [Klebsormidium nitens]